MTEESVQTSSLTEAQALRIAAARAAHAAGIAVMPLLGRTKKPARQGWQMAEFPDLAVTAEWARVANIGFRTGSISKGLVVIDWDPGADITGLGALPDTVTVFTGRTDAVTGQRETLIAWYARRGYLVTGKREPFPYHDPRAGTPRRADLVFEVLEKPL